MTTSISGTGGITFPDGSVQPAAASPYTLKNKIINGSMVIDQRNAGASVNNASSSNTFPVDRFAIYGDSASKVSGQRSTTVPTGFVNSVLLTSLAATTAGANDFYGFRHNVEGFNVADLGWGSANAQTVTLSFWVRSSLTGTFSVSFSNNAANRAYVANYVISVANTWEQKTVTIAGDTSGTWTTDNTTGIGLWWDLGSGANRAITGGSWSGTYGVKTSNSTNLVATNGATFYITGVQLEVGSTATPFERRLYNQELANCQRYYQKLGNGTIADIVIGSGISRSSTIAAIYVKHNIPMRAAPTITQSSLVVTDAETYNATVTSISINASTSESRVVATCSGGGMTQYRPALLSQITSGTGYLDLSAEL